MERFSSYYSAPAASGRSFSALATARTGALLVVPSALVDDGLPILRPATEAEARAMMDEEPLTRLSRRTDEMDLWYGGPCG